jgi:hypothetical protein
MFKWFRRSEPVVPLACTDLTPSVIIHTRTTSDSIKISIVMYNVELQYSDERGSRLKSAHTSVSLEITGADPWISFGLFTRRESGDLETIPF